MPFFVLCGWPQTLLSETWKTDRQTDPHTHTETLLGTGPQPNWTQSGLLRWYLLQLYLNSIILLLTEKRKCSSNRKKYHHRKIHFLQGDTGQIYQWQTAKSAQSEITLNNDWHFSPCSLEGNLPSVWQYGKLFQWIKHFVGTNSTNQQAPFPDIN